MARRFAGFTSGVLTLGLAALAAAPVACGSAGGSLGIGDDGGAANGDDGAAAATDGAPAIGDDGGSCGATNAACSAGGDCCSHLCLGGVCVASIGACAGAGGACVVGTDCCGGSCVNGACAAGQCASVGQACPASGAAGCCTDTCAGGKCVPIGGGAADGGTGGACTTAGNACAKSAECCSGLCANGTCDIASSYCTQNGDICFHDADCCGGICKSPDASAVSPTNPGTCAQPTASGGTNCSGVDGTLCDPSQIGCAAGCCSHLCAPFGPTGVAICQQAQGCHVEGDLCRKDADCCGGEPSSTGILGAGLVKCTLAPGETIGVCTTPSASNGGGNTCVPEGDVCHYTKDPGYTCPSSSARADCCGDQTPKFVACRLDKLGVPRCLAYGLSDGGADGCRPTGATCATAADCCDGSPCVPDGTGQLACSGTACIPSSGACTSSADCCAGITCVVPAGAASGTCAPLPPPPAPTDGGTPPPPPPDGGGLGCGSLGQSCASLACCTGLECVGGSCAVPPR